ncbi:MULTISPECIES: hypothetical protein [unclassified Microcoleus]|uniref:hypothetical protein n=1 Tax=unclassified Microcoleus TaxID=2642155 RepID=UPI0025FD9220|nr:MULTISPECIES: hypothetical protein [unclassified Microcoleus]
MYTLEQLREKTFKKLKEIGYQLDILPAGDRRCRQNWIDAIVGVKPPLLKLLEVSSDADRPRNRLIEEIDFAEFGELTFFELIELCRNTEKHLEDKPLKQLQHLRMKILDLTARPSAGVFLGNKTHRASWVLEIRHQLTFLVQTRSLVKVPRGLGRVEELLWKTPIIEDFDALLLHVQFFPETKDATSEIELQAQEPPIESKKDLIKRPTEEPQIQEPPIESKFGRILYPKPAAEPIALAAEISRGVSFDVEEFQQTHAAEIDAYVASFSDDRPPNRGTGDRGRLESEPRLSQSAIAPAAENSPGVDRQTSIAHQLLERLKPSPYTENFPTLSDTFLSRYSPPQSESLRYQADADGQLSLLDFEVESADEPPDPDDFDSLDAFREALARWDTENPESRTVSMDSMTEWAPCPGDWYEPAAEVLPPEASSMKVLELSPAIETIESSSTCEFLIPVFGAAGDRQNDKDEPPNAGSFARLPNPKPPSFPPMGVVAGDRANRIKKFARSAILWSGRSPPGGDASF